MYLRTKPLHLRKTAQHPYERNLLAHKGALYLHNASPRMPQKKKKSISASSVCVCVCVQRTSFTEALYQPFPPIPTQTTTPAQDACGATWSRTNTCTLPLSHTHTNTLTLTHTHTHTHHTQLSAGNRKRSRCKRR